MISRSKSAGFFLWGHYKANVCGRTLPVNQDDLVDRIAQAPATVTEEMLANCSENLLKKARKCIEVGGGHFEHLI